MLTYLDNIQTHPDEEKYRRIRKGNAVFHDRVATVPGAVGKDMDSAWATS